ncbi:unnamed protein product [Anisakis simplex]|uniref:MAM domain-containing protein n=1 Tax=Anisakis simplex TaxID=6269 RepID=A0A0M3K3W8_ANISI|nr:unnamed protein product [Anisakis simplex]
MVKDLNCNFDRRAVDCLWANDESEADNQDWLIGSSPINKHKFVSLTGIEQMPVGEFAFVRLESGHSATLLTEPIRCVTDEAILTFRFWHTESAQLSVCLLEEKMPEIIDCQPIVLPQPGPAVVDIPGMGHSFRIAFKAESSEQSKGMIMIDDISVQGNICPSSLRQHGIKTSSFKSVEVPDQNVCQLLSCQFVKGQMCLYKSGRVTLSQSQFQPSDGTVFAKLFTRGRIAVLESPTFTLNAPARVHFSYRKEFGSPELFICQDSATKELENCFEIGSNSNTTEWTNDFMEILPSDTKFYVFAKLTENMRKAQLALKNFTVTDLDDNLVCSSS